MSVFAATAEFFDGLAARHGADPRSADWGSATSQAARFHVLCAVAPLAGRTVLDVGCGVGALAGHLAEHAPGTTYRGIDISGVAVATARRTQAGIDVRVANVLDGDVESADVVIANGILYRLGEDGAQLAQSLIGRLFELARVAVAFTSLSAWGPEGEPGEYRADPLRTLAFCRTLTPRVALRHDYLPHDFCAYLYR